jgi:hypothetical protein
MIAGWGFPGMVHVLFYQLLLILTTSGIVGKATIEIPLLSDHRVDLNYDSDLQIGTVGRMVQSSPSPSGEWLSAI